MKQEIEFSEERTYTVTSQPPIGVFFSQQTPFTKTAMARWKEKSWFRLLFLLLLYITRTASELGAVLSPRIDWIPCPRALYPGVDCGTIEVPLTYQPGNSTQASGCKTTTLFLSRLKSTGNGSQDIVFYNSGKANIPAAYHVSTMKYYSSLGFEPEVHKEHDIIGLDPRGVGYSSAVKCDLHLYNKRVRTFVNNSREYDALVDHNRRLGQSCAELTGDLFYHLDALHVAKDFELVRQALGAKKFNFLGLSYGSLIGTQYLSLFPNNVGRMVLDGVIDHSQSEISTALAESTAYERVLERFFKWCTRRTNCWFRLDSPREAFDELLAQADTAPIAAEGCYPDSCQPNVTGEEIRYNVQDFLQHSVDSYGEGWGFLADAIAKALEEGDARALSTSLMRKNEDLKGHTAVSYAHLAIGCQDWLRAPSSFADYDRQRKTIALFTPRTAGASRMFYLQSRCIGWPAPVSNGQSALSSQVHDAPPILLVHSVYDPIGSIAGAERLRRQLPTAVSISRNGSGHTSHMLLGETRKAIDDYLATGKMPRDGEIFPT
jgi:pimeloyl-ACP methyl ester carboxylesterase